MLLVINYKTMLIKGKLGLFYVILLNLVCSDEGLDLVEPLIIYRQVYTLEHLHHVSTCPSGSGHYIRDTLLVLYNATCRGDVDALGLLGGSLPSMPLLAILFYDWVEFPARVWYEQTTDERLETLYPPRGCPSVLFLPRGHRGAEDIRYWEAGSGDVKEWVWGQMEKHITIVNECEKDMKVKIISRNSQLNRTISLAADESCDLLMYKSDRVIAFNGERDEFVQGMVVENDDSITLKCQTPHRPSLEYSFDGCNDQTRVDPDMSPEHAYLDCVTSTERNSIRGQVNMAGQTLYSLKHHHIIPLHTQHGYEKRSVPSELYTDILNFYLSKRHKLEPEASSVSHLINYDHVQTGLVLMSMRWRAYLAGELQATLEEWCGCELEYTHGYGIREYYNGSVLHNHVDRIDTHVISAIVQVWKELEGGEDWPLEIIDLDGHRQHVYLEPGEMILYESTKMIHGRPQPFRGRVYANAFFHFRPLKWQHKFNLLRTSREMKLKYDDGEMEDLFPLETPLTGHLVKARGKQKEEININREEL